MRKETNKTDEEKILVSKDRIKLALERYRCRKSIIAELFSYLGAILTLFITVATGQYSDFWFLTADALEGVFITLLAMMVLIFIIRFCYMFARKKYISDDESFVDCLEYKEKIKTANDYNKKYCILINLLLSILLLLIIGLYLFLGFIAKWHWAYDVFVSVIAFSIIGVYISQWKDMYDNIYQKVKRQSTQEVANDDK